MESISESKSAVISQEGTSFKVLQKASKLQIRLLNHLDIKTFGVLFFALLSFVVLHLFTSMGRSGAGDLSVTLAIFLLVNLFLFGKMMGPAIRLFTLKAAPEEILIGSEHASSLDTYVQSIQQGIPSQFTEFVIKQNWMLSQVLKKKNQLFDEVIFWLVPFFLFQLFQVFVWSLLMFR